MPRSLLLVLAVAATVSALVVASSLQAAQAVTILNGKVGPSFTITLKKGGKKVTRLPAGRYKFVVRDLSSIHDFHLTGPGVNRVITSVAFTGTKSVILNLRRGRYNYVCDPHSSSMHGSFRVT